MYRNNDESHFHIFREKISLWLMIYKGIDLCSKTKSLPKKCIQCHGRSQGTPHPTSIFINVFIHFTRKNSRSDSGGMYRHGEGDINSN